MKNIWVETIIWTVLAICPVIGFPYIINYYIPEVFDINSYIAGFGMTSFFYSMIIHFIIYKEINE